MEEKTQINIWIDQSMATELSDRAWERRLSVSEFVRRAIRVAIDACKAGE